MDVAIRPLTVDTWPALEELFLSVTDSRWCWCQYWRLRGKDFHLTSADENRRRMRALAEGPTPPGLVALEADGRAVGWVSLAPRVEHERIVRSRLIPAVDDRPVWSIACFVVLRRIRGRGVARALLAAAIEHARRDGAPALEAYPADTPGRIASSAAYTGTRSMFETVGFTVVATTDSVTGGAPRVVMRLELGERDPDPASTATD